MAYDGLEPTGDPELVVLAGRLLDDLDDFSLDLATQIREKVEFYRRADGLGADDLRLSCRANANFVLRSIHGRGDADIRAAQETGRRRADQDVPLAQVMAAFRVGFGRIWQILVDRARDEGKVTSDALVDAASDIWAVHDTFAEAMAAAYRETATAAAIRDERERSALVAALLEGRLLDELTVWDIAELLRLPHRGPFVVVSAEATRIAREGLPGVEAALRAAGMGSAWRLLPDLQVGIVRLGDDGRTERLREVLAPLARSRVGLSPPYDHLGGNTGKLRFSRIALASTPPGTTTVNRFDDEPLAVAAVSAPDAMRRVARSVLGEVLDLPTEQSTLLLDTLAAWRDNDGSATATARQMFCHPNTIRQRLRKLESATGRSLSSPHAAAELFLALEAVTLLDER